MVSGCFVRGEYIFGFTHLYYYNAGDVVYANALGRPMIILGSAQAADDLLEHRSSNYSDRPRFTMAAEL
jgi:hypothetical protein